MKDKPLTIFITILILFSSELCCEENTDTPVNKDNGLKNTKDSNRKQRPNVILIIADDLGFNDVSFHGSMQIPTPNIDALAFSGVILNSYYVSPICTPSRSALFSGMHPIHTGMQHNVIYGTTPFGFPLSYKLLPEYLKELGYSTHLIGKWHLGHFRKEYTPTCRGFDSHFGHWTGHKDYYDNTAEEEYKNWGYDMRQNLDVTYDGWGNYSTDLYTEKAIELINTHAQQNGGKPLFLTMSHTAVHSANPYEYLQAPVETVRRFGYIKDLNRRKYAAMVAKLDESVGSLIDALGSHNMLRNSIVVFTTDNGGPAAGFNHNAASNWPLRGVKNTLWEGGVRGAGFIWSPMLQDIPRVSSQLMHVQDWLPTLIGGIGANISELVDTKTLDGLNMWDVLSKGEKPSPRKGLVHNIDDQYGNEAVRVGEWKLMHGTTYGGKWDGWYGPSGLEDENKVTNDVNVTSYVHYEYMQNSVSAKVLKNLELFPSLKTVESLSQISKVVCPDSRRNTCDLLSGEYCLYNVIDDPCEYNNLAKERQDKVDELKLELKKYRESAVPPRNQPPDQRASPKFWNYTWTNWMDYVDPISSVSICGSH